MLGQRPRPADLRRRGWPKQRVDQIDGARRRAKLAVYELLSAPTKCCRVSGIIEAAADECFESRCISYDDGALGGHKRRDDVTEVPRVGAECDGGAVSGRLDHVLSAAAAEAAADEGDLRRAPPSR